MYQTASKSILWVKKTFFHVESKGLHEFDSNVQACPFPLIYLKACLKFIRSFRSDRLNKFTQIPQKEFSF